ncbi:Predicted kinase, aminoglycoside phosphotransferase (APT) family [Loktanella fryxellensis]|uniref:Predicted kinase, aminoglycoside phosphotransferase (APT) family n=1 Tax=Loktanella fryxellensis TaxID=245187 RepID=A0A1H8FCY3_9RHOB|nr:phosphotransferase family protein [Loktanella fryxellensis]SEN29334.1 Predicted kinase, aminoglycoside phosphotransferase (APT) family [Loktanella fryxellensis]
MTDDPDMAAIATWVDGRLPGLDGPVRLHRFQVGQSNPTYRIQTEAGDYVLRRKPLGTLLKSAHAVEREYAVQRALQGTVVPVPRMHLLCEDAGVIGAPFYLMDHVAGRSFDDPRLPNQSPSKRAAIMDAMNATLAAIHLVDPVAAGLGGYGPDGDYYARQIARWIKQYSASATEDMAAMDQLIDWLQANRPADDGRRTLVHGDYRIDNLLFAQGGTDVVAVLDWELSTLGHPFADLAGVIMQWRMPPGPDGRGLAGVDRAALGLPSDADFIAAYCARMGLPGIDGFGFYLAFCFFRMGAILQGVKRRGLDGNAANPEKAAKLGAYAPEFARQGLLAAREG